MDKNNDFGGFSPYDMPNDFNSDMYKDPMFNPMLQYEQAYMYYRYLTMQMDYKIKCKEYEKMTSKDRKAYRMSSTITSPTYTLKNCGWVLENFATFTMKFILLYHLLYNILFRSFHLANIVVR